MHCFTKEQLKEKVCEAIDEAYKTGNHDGFYDAVEKQQSDLILAQSRVKRLEEALKKLSVPTLSGIGAPMCSCYRLAKEALADGGEKA